jgi:protein farnesyltransferase subunit beta
MTFRIKGPNRSHKVRFPKAMETSSQEGSAPSSTNIEPPAKNQTDFLIEELPPSEAGEDMWEDEPIEETNRAAQPFIPDLYTSWPLIQDALNTATSYVQNDTIIESLPYLNGTCGAFDSYNHHGIPHLDRARHIRFLHKSLQSLPSGYVASDAARPWFFYWALCGLRTLGEDVTIYRERLVNSVQPMQNPTGGFGGGHGQMSHLAPTYAILLALSMVGGEEALEIVDRKAMWRWLGTIKQPDGGFQVCLGGEEDVR